MKSLEISRDETEALREEMYGRTIVFLFVISFAIALFPLSRTNYLLFHTLVELTSIAFSFTLFSIGWNARKFTQNDSFLLLATAFLIVGSLDVLHTLSYKGMGVFPVEIANPPTQYWIAARFVQAASYLIAAFHVGKSRRLKPWLTLACYLIGGFLLKLTIWPLQIFPECYVEATGLTTFKIAAEYLICFILGVSGFLFWTRKQHFNPDVLKFLLLSIVLTILSEFSFTLYQDIYGISNILGHILKLASVVALYRAFVYGALKTPYSTLFHELTESHVALDKELEQRQKKEKELQEANMELEAFVRTVSHDLRKPLTVISSGAELLQYELDGQINSSQKKVLSSIEDQGHRMSKLMDDLLNLAKVGTPDQERQSVKPSLVAAQVLEDLSQDIMAKKCRIEIRDMPEIQGHPSLIYQLLLNLVSNAVSYGANPEKPIEVGATLQDNVYRIYVKDHGSGISSEDKDNIFTLFYRGDQSKTQGTGIGLAIVQKIAQLYSGRAFIEDTAGGGATFWVELAIDKSSSEHSIKRAQNNTSV